MEELTGHLVQTLHFTDEKTKAHWRLNDVVKVIQLIIFIHNIKNGFYPDSCS